jgi:hypothetical protein
MQTVLKCDFLFINLHAQDFGYMLYEGEGLRYVQQRCGLGFCCGLCSGFCQHALTLWMGIAKLFKNHQVAKALQSNVGLIVSGTVLCTLRLTPSTVI